MESQLIDLSNRQEYESVVEHGKIFDLNKFVTNDQFSTPPKQRGKHYLTSGAVYKGIQRSDRKDYEVKVELQVADFTRPLVYGYLTIYNLTEDAPSLTTFFEAEVIGRGEHSFLTNKWETNSEIDHGHWSKFPEFFQYQTVFTSEIPFDYERVTNDDEIVFMRWKELFMVPDYRIEYIEGASFAGFYYICCKPKKGIIDGFYYHRSNDVYQQLLLAYYPPSCSIEQQVN